MNLRFSLTLTFIVSFALTGILWSQSVQKDKLLLTGTVYGYKFDPSRKILNKGNETELEGTLSGVKIVVFSGKSKIASVEASENGEFALYIPLGTECKFEFSKSGYVTSTFLIDMTGIPPDLAQRGVVFRDMELILNSFISKDTDDQRPFGKLYYSTGNRALQFSEIVYDDKKKLFKKEENTPLNLMEGALAKNMNANKDGGSSSELNEANNSSGNQINKVNSGSEEDENTTNGTQSTEKKVGKLVPLKKFTLDNLKSEDLDDRQLEIDQAWKQIEIDKQNASTPEQFQLIEAREEILRAAEKELEDARKYIALQEEELSAQRMKMIFLVGLVIALAFFGFFVFRSMKQKEQLNRELEAKNKKIMTSINYAFRIQQSVLPESQLIAKTCSGGFVLYQPLDVVSGDFYWMHQEGSKIIMAVVDCTGHGVPGAFMSLIGNTLLNEIVLEKKIFDPLLILEQLHTGIVKSLRQEESSENNQDGMDMSLCSIDTISGKLDYAGAMNPAYLIANGEVVDLEPSLRGIGGVNKRMKKEFPFVLVSKQLKKGDVLFMSSDGFMDQFGGANNEKFNLPRFRELLLETAKLKNSDRSGHMEKAFNAWKGQNSQTDDVLVLGIEY